jgi:probable HAF family extracellular repeat protein
LGGTNGLLGPFIYGLNNRGEVVGVMALPGENVTHAFLWDRGTLSDLNSARGALGGNFSEAKGLNDAGEVIGDADLPGDQSHHAVVWRDGAMVDLGTLHGDPCSTSESINSRGQIVGASQSGCDQFTEAFLWENVGPIVDLNTLVPAGSPLLLTGAFWINDRGEITGRGVPPGCDDVDTCGHAFLLIPCDEDHPGIRHCDYELMDTETPPIQAVHTSATPARGALTSPNVITQRRYARSKRSPGFAQKPK